MCEIRYMKMGKENYMSCSLLICGEDISEKEMIRLRGGWRETSGT